MGPFAGKGVYGGPGIGRVTIRPERAATSFPCYNVNMRNAYTELNGVFVIPVEHKGMRYECRIDAADLPRACAFPGTWAAHPASAPKGKFYVTGKAYAGHGKSRTVMFHRWLLEPSSKVEVHHADNDGLNNTRGNLSLKNHRDNLRERWPGRDWTDRDRRRALRAEHAKERKIGAKIAAQHNLSRVGMFKIRTGKTRGSSAVFAYFDACKTAKVRSLELLKFAVAGLPQHPKTRV